MPEPTDNKSEEARLQITGTGKDKEEDTWSNGCDNGNEKYTYLFLIPPSKCRFSIQYALPTNQHEPKRDTACRYLLNSRRYESISQQLAACLSD